MKKSFATVLTAGLLLQMMTLGSFAAEAESAKVYVTISDDQGKLVMVQKSVTVTDADGDGALTIHDALYHAHDVGYEGGAVAGYQAVESQWGISLTKLWGVSNGGSYGYVVNNASAMSLTDPVKSGDYLSAYVYTDLTTWSDTYCYFDQHTLSAKAGDKITLTLSASGYDADWNPVTLPVAGATLLINGEKTDYVTDSNGKVTISAEKAGKLTISASSDSMTLVPPVCTVNVSEASVNVPTTGDRLMGVSVAAILALCGVVLAGKRSKKYENE